MEVGNIGSDAKAEAKTFVDKLTDEARSILNRLIAVNERMNNAIQRLSGPSPSGEAEAEGITPTGELGMLEEVIRDLGRTTTSLENHMSSLESM